MIRKRIFVVLPLLGLTLVAGVVRAADDWLPITPADLAMKDSAMSPGAHAVLLYREVETDDVKSVEYHYYRIKIFTETGKKYADIEIPYVKGWTKISDIKARTVRPDGTELKFDGEVFDKVVVKTRGIKLQAKTFSLPEVQVGSIIEYRYRIRWPEQQLNSPSWVVQHDLPTQRLNLTFKPWPTFALSWTSRLPAGGQITEPKKNLISLQLENVPGFQEEEQMPPESEMKYRVDFFYFRRAPESADKFWVNEGKDWYGIIEEFIGKRKGIQQAAMQIVAPEDPAETKLLKLYTRVQKIRNLSYERDKSEQEERREKLKDNNHVEDVLKNGYGYRNEITRLFVALARGAGLDSMVVRVAQRDDQFFQKNLLNWRQLDSEVAVVRVGDKDQYLDPGTPGCPFGMLSWLRSGVTGLRPTKNGGDFISTPQPTSEQAIVERTGTLRMDEEGNLRGKVQVTFRGLEALTRRLSARETDDTGRRKELEDEIKRWLSAGATVKLGEVTGWDEFDQPLRAEVDLEIPGFAVAAGRRTLLPLGVFQANEIHPFRHANRIHPVYLRNPYREADDLIFELPANLRVESVPQQRNNMQGFGSYQIVRVNGEQGLRLQRLLVLEGYFFPVQYYGTLRNFFSEVRAGDEEQVVLQSAEAVQRNNQ